MTAFASWLFIGVVWLSNGTPQPTISNTYRTHAKCSRAAVVFRNQVDEANADISPKLQMTYHTECRVVTNDSDARAE